ncbi:MAG TPA: LysM peptidoglycan-binding domain-containing protein [Lacipirellulaceae bacterium]|nr:LysM peptidoglycan-binding domain-containing protein [Lacipirellulaceae bacterium]
MNSIRPLFTITVLVVVGGYLYWKINEGPVQHHGKHGVAADSQSGIPPLAAVGGGATLAQDSSAPAWPPATSVAPASPPVAATRSAADADAKNSMPEVPPIPELPELPKTTDTAPGTLQPVAPPSMEFPKATADGHAANDGGPNFGAGSTAGPLASLPAIPTNTPDAPSNLTPIPGAPLGGAANSAITTPFGGAPLGSEATKPNDPGAPLAIPPATSATSATLGTPAVSSQNALRAAPASNSINPPSDDRYGAVASAATSSPPAVPVMSPLSTSPGATFAASWPAIQAALDRNDLKGAHKLLSKWHGDETLSPADAQKVDTLLGQLAGTVIYSTENQLEPARVVKPGETLDTIAKDYNVPWQLLAKINGIPAADQVRPGQSLKVVRGPFSAVVDLHRQELVLEVDGRFAGTFPVSVSPGTNVGEGQWLVDQKLDGIGSSIAPTAYAPAPASNRTIVLRNDTTSGTIASSPMLLIAANSPGGPPSSSSAIRVAPQDAEDLADILSIGSRVIVRR